MFDVLLNDVHPIITDLDIFREVGHATAHDEYIQFTISRGKLFIKNGGVSEVRNGRVRVSFIKGQHDNPKINAIVLVKGSDVNEFPRLPPLVVKSTPKTIKGSDDQDPAEDNYVFDEPRDRYQADNNKHDDFEDENEEGVEKRIRRTSGPKQPDPYGSQENSSLYTILFIIVAMIIPIVILKCRL